MHLMCAGPTKVRKSAIAAMGKFLTNPDLDPEYVTFHRQVEKKYSSLLNTDAPSIIMLGEAIMGLEASVVSLMKKNDRVLVLSNGFFGAGFKDYVESYGGVACVYENDFRKSFDLDELEKYIIENGPFKLATMVHCETPTGLTNDIKKICGLLKKYDMLTIVDGVSSVLGEEINFDEINTDILIGGTQKAISAPTGLTLLTLSKKAIDLILSRNDICGYYLNIKNYLKYEGDFAFPYTMNENLVYALDAALDEISKEDFVAIHKRFAAATRASLKENDLELYPESNFSSTLTAVVCPQKISAKDLLGKMKSKGFLLSGSMGHLADRVFRIGHMGGNNNYEDFLAMYKALDECFLEFDFKTSLASSFEKFFKEF